MRCGCRRAGSPGGSTGWGATASSSGGRARRVGGGGPPPPAGTVVVVSKNANVATGAAGLADAEELAAGIAARLGCAPEEILVASTGVIGRAYPMDRVRAGVAAVTAPLPVDDACAVARAIMT